MLSIQKHQFPTEKVIFLKFISMLKLLKLLLFLDTGQREKYVSAES